MVLQSYLPEFFFSVGGVIIVLLVLINAVSFGAFALDKYKAIRGEWRISERVLFWLAGIGGAAGALIGMKLFRHKTRHPKFSIGIPILLILQIITAIVVIILFL